MPSCLATRSLGASGLGSACHHTGPDPQSQRHHDCDRSGHPLPILGSDPSVTGTETSWSAGISTDDSAITLCAEQLCHSGYPAVLLGRLATFRFSGNVTVKAACAGDLVHHRAQPADRQQPEHHSLRPPWPCGATARRRSTPCACSRAARSTSSAWWQAWSKIRCWATYNTVLLPFLNLLTGYVLMVASDDGTDPTRQLRQGHEPVCHAQMSELPVLSLLHAALPQLGLDTRSVILSIGLLSTAGYRISAGALLNIKVLDTTPVSLEFNELGIKLSSAQTTTSIGVMHRFTLTLLSEVLVFRGGVTVEQTGGASAVTVWGALDPDQARGTTWKDPGASKASKSAALACGCRAVPPSASAVAADPHWRRASGRQRRSQHRHGKPHPVYRQPRRSGSARLISAFLSGLPQATKDALGCSTPRSRFGSKDLKLYFAPNGGEIAGKTFERGISLGASLDLWGYRANIFGRMDEARARSSKANRSHQHRSRRSDAFAVLDVSGQNGPNVDFALTSSRQGIFYSGQLRLLGGAYQGL